MYPHSDGGYRQTPGLVEFAAYAGPATNNDFSSLINTQVNNNPLSFDYNSDGTKMIVLSQGDESLYQYSCFPSYGQPSVYDSRTLDLSAVNPVSIFWISNTSLRVLTSGGVIKLYTGTANQIDTFTDASDDYSLASLTGTPEDCYTDDGTNWIVQTTTGTFHYTFNFSSLTFQTSTTTQLNFFTESGKSFFTSAKQYRTNTAWDLANLYEVGDMDLEDDDLPDSGSRTAFVVRPFNENFASVGRGGPGTFYLSWASTDLQGVSGGAFRGADVMGGVPYVVFGTSLLSFDSSGDFAAYTDGIVGTGSVVSDTDGTNVVYVTGANEYRFRLSDGVTTISNSNISGAISVAYLDSAFNYAKDDRIWASDLLDPTTIGALNFLTAESNTDSILRNKSLNQLHYSFGSDTTEIHFTSGAGNTRLSRQAVLEHGIIGTQAIDSIDDTIYFVDAERRLSVMRGFDYAPLNISGLGKEFASYTTVSDCIVNAFTYEQENFIEVTFPTENVTWTIHEPSGEVIKREDASNGRSRSAAFMNVYGNTYSVDHTNGKIYQFSDSNFQEDGSNFARTLYSAQIQSEAFGFSTREFTLDALYLEHEVSASTDFTVSVSMDSGLTFEMANTVTVTGRGTERLPGFGMASEVIVQVTTSSNTEANVLGLAAEAEALDD